jgi:hydroxyacylglutathione hydrolase
MITITSFTVNPYQENTFILHDETSECVIIDPGMYTGAEQNEVAAFIRAQSLKPVALLNTHCHIDHVIGNKFVFDNWGLLPRLTEKELEVLNFAPSLAYMQGIRYEASPLPEEFLPETGSFSFGNSSLEIIFAPGHSPGHVCFYNREQDFLVGGDVLFRRSIGRTDLPGGDHHQLLASIRSNLFTLPDTCTVWPGHGPATTIGYEKANNPFLNGFS